MQRSSETNNADITSTSLNTWKNNITKLNAANLNTLANAIIKNQDDIKAVVGDEETANPDDITLWGVKQFVTATKGELEGESGDVWSDGDETLHGLNNKVDGLVNVIQGTANDGINALTLHGLTNRIDSKVSSVTGNETDLPDALTLHGLRKANDHAHSDVLKIYGGDVSDIPEKNLTLTKANADSVERDRYITGLASVPADGSGTYNDSNTKLREDITELDTKLVTKSEELQQEIGMSMSGIIGNSSDDWNNGSVTIYGLNNKVDGINNDLTKYATIDWVKTYVGENGGGSGSGGGLLYDDIIVSETEPTVTGETIWIQPLTTDTGAIDYIIESGILDGDTGYYEKWNSGIVKYYVKQTQDIDGVTGITSITGILSIPTSICKKIITHNITATNLSSSVKVDVTCGTTEDTGEYLEIYYNLYFASMTATVETNHSIIGKWK